MLAGAGEMTAMFIDAGSVIGLFDSSARAATAESRTAGTAFSMICGFKLW